MKDCFRMSWTKKRELKEGHEDQRDDQLKKRRRLAGYLWKCGSETHKPFDIYWWAYK